MKLRDKRYLKFEVMMALAAVVASLVLRLITSDAASFVLFLIFGDVVDTFEGTSLFLIVAFAFGSTLSWKLLGSDKQTCFWQTLSLLTTVFNAIIWVLVIVLLGLILGLMYGFDSFLIFLYCIFWFISACNHSSANNHARHLPLLQVPA